MRHRELGLSGDLVRQVETFLVAYPAQASHLGYRSVADYIERAVLGTLEADRDLARNLTDIGAVPAPTPRRRGGGRPR